MPAPRLSPLPCVDLPRAEALQDVERGATQAQRAVGFLARRRGVKADEVEASA